MSTSSAPAADADIDAFTRELSDVFERSMSPTARTRLRYGRPGSKGLRTRVAAVRRRMAARTGPVLPEQLHELDVAMRLDSDPAWVEPPPHPLGVRRPVFFYNADGTAIPDEPREVWLAAMSRYERMRDRRVAATVLYRHGCRVFVSTVFLGLDQSLGDRSGPPILWETMIFVGGIAHSGWIGEDEFARRYASRAAALAGHRQILTALRAAFVPPPHRVRPPARPAPWTTVKRRRRRAFA